MTVRHGKYAGVFNILQFNLRSYVASLCTILGIATFFWFRILPAWSTPILIVAAAVTAFWTFSSLAASYYVYDYVGVTRWRWIPEFLLSSPKQWLNIHAGLDESTEILAGLFPNTSYRIVDIYDAQEMTEPSIARARKAQSSVAVNGKVQPVTVGKLDALPAADNERDTLFLLFAAHEVRQPARRAELFREAWRVLADGGQLVLVEHLRDWKNFVAFGPGFLHFYSRSEWLSVAGVAGFLTEREDQVTPLVRCFSFRKSGARS